MCLWIAVYGCLGVFASFVRKSTCLCVCVSVLAHQQFAQLLNRQMNTPSTTDIIAHLLTHQRFAQLLQPTTIVGPACAYGAPSDRVNSKQVGHVQNYNGVFHLENRLPSAWLAGSKTLLKVVHMKALFCTVQEHGGHFQKHRLLS